MIASVSHMVRLLNAAWVLARYDIALPSDFAKAVPAPARWLGHLARFFRARGAAGLVRADKLSAALAALGPAYIKLGQFLATRPDILGAELAADLSALQDRLPPFSKQTAQAIVAQELGSNLSDVFSSFSAPIAAASIAQVHKAQLAGVDGAEGTVAVKVLRPSVESAFAKDLAAFAFAAKWVERLAPQARRLEPVQLVETVRKSVELELDLRFEAAAASEMDDRTLSDPNFQVAAINWELTTKRVMTSQWVDGIPVADHSALQADGFDLDEVGLTLLQTFLTHALRDGVFHADMHPGNLFVTRNLEDGPPVLVAIDFGIIGRLDRSMRRFMAETLMGFLTRDYARIADVHFDVGFVSETKCRDTFAQALRSVGEPVFGRASTDISMARLLAQLFEVTRLFDMHLQPQLVLLQKTMVVVEGVARSLSPNINMWEAARPIVQDWMTSELGPEARIADAAETALSFARAARRAPAVLDKMEQAADRLAAVEAGASPAPSGGAADRKKLSPETRAALWISAAALAGVVYSIL